MYQKILFILNLKQIPQFYHLNQKRITFLNYDFIEIKSNYAKYDKETSETLFYGNVLSSYSDHLISSNELKLLFDKKLAKIKDNVVYKSNDGRLEADEVLLNLYDKKAKISMNDSEEMVKISYLNQYGAD